MLRIDAVIGKTVSQDRKVADLLSLLEISRQLGATVELGPLLQTIERAALQVLDCERATIFLHDARTDELVSRVAREEGEIRFPASKGIAGEVFRTGHVISVPDAYNDPRFNPEVDRRTGFLTRSILACPLLGIDSRPVGVLQVLNKRHGTFDTWDEELLRTFGAQAGVAVQRQGLMEEYAAKREIESALAVARSIQQGLLPRTAPAAPGYAIAGWNQPTNETGGDFYDIQELGNGTIALTVADVTGHGIGPALIAAECRALLRASLSLTQHLERVMALVNELLHVDLPPDRFVTAFIGLLIPAEHRFHYISAGHGPLLHFTAATGEVQELMTSGLPLGILPGRTYELSRAIVLEPGDMLVFLTDGFVEWPDPARNRFGNPRLYDVLRARHHLPPAELIQAIYQAVQDFAQGTPQADDLTAVIIKRNPQG